MLEALKATVYFGNNNILKKPKLYSPNGKSIDINSRWIEFTILRYFLPNKSYWVIS